MNGTTTNESGTTNAILIVLLMVVVLAVGYFLFRNTSFGNGNGTSNTLNIQLPAIPGTNSSTGGSTNNSTNGY